MRKGLQKIETRFSKLGKQEITLRQAIFFVRKTASLTDAIIDAKIGITKFEKKNLRERNNLWQTEYTQAVEGLFSLPEFKKNPELKNIIVGLHDYFALPTRIHNSRKKHWRLIQKIEENINKKNISPEQNLLEEIERIKKKSKTGQTNKVKALDVCVASSIYADLMNQKKQGSWTIHYRTAMELAYKKLKQNPEILREIINLK